jgi:nitroreductase
VQARAAFGLCALPTVRPAVTDDPLALMGLLFERRSIGPRGLGLPAPPPEALQTAAELALRAPDHQGLRPFRFVHVGAQEREALGDLFAEVARAQGRDPSAVDLARSRAASGPGLLAVVAQIRDDQPEVPPHEQWLSVGAAVMNLLNALHLQGFGAKVLGGAAAQHPIVRQAFCHAGERIACWVITGTPTAQSHDSEPPPPARGRRELLLDWVPPPLPPSYPPAPAGVPARRRADAPEDDR